MHKVYHKIKQIARIIVKKRLTIVNKCVKI